MDLPSQEYEPERYKGRPILIVIENYILDAIGALDDKQRSGMLQIVQRVWGGGPDWRATVRKELDWKETIDASLRGLWDRNREIAEQNGISLHPNQFAKMIANENFVQAISRIGDA